MQDGRDEDALEGDVSDRFTRDEYIRLYTYQSELYWKLFSPVALIEGATIAGWYAVWKDGFAALANLVLIAGSIVLLVQFALIGRAGQFLKFYGDGLRTMQEGLPASFFGVTGRRVGFIVPALFILMHVALAASAPVAPKASASPSPPSTPDHSAKPRDGHVPSR